MGEIKHNQKKFSADEINRLRAMAKQAHVDIPYSWEFIAAGLKMPPARARYCADAANKFDSALGEIELLRMTLVEISEYMNETGNQSVFTRVVDRWIERALQGTTHFENERAENKRLSDELQVAQAKIIRMMATGSRMQAWLQAADPTLSELLSEWDEVRTL